MSAQYVPGMPNPYFPVHKYCGVPIDRNIKPIGECRVHHYADSTAGMAKGIAVHLLTPEHLWATFQAEAEEMLKVNGSFSGNEQERNKRINAAYAKLWLADTRFQWGRRRCTMISVKRTLVSAAAVLFAAWWLSPSAVHTTLSFEIGATVEEVAKQSSYPVIARSNLPADDPGATNAGATWVTEPAVTIRFNDPKHGFTLPPTTFAALTYMHYKVETLATSPMLEALSFDEALVVLGDLQKQFKAGGWEPWTRNESVWFDLTPAGKNQLYQQMFKPGYERTTILRVPNKYSMTFRLKCAEGCWTREPPYLFLIDIGLSDDVYGRTQDDPIENQ